MKIIIMKIITKIIILIMILFTVTTKRKGRRRTRRRRRVTFVLQSATRLTTKTLIIDCYCIITGYMYDYSLYWIIETCLRNRTYLEEKNHMPALSRFNSLTCLCACLLVCHTCLLKRNSTYLFIEEFPCATDTYLWNYHIRVLIQHENHFPIRCNPYTLVLLDIKKAEVSWYSDSFNWLSLLG